MNNNTCYDITLYIVKPFYNKYPGIAWKRKQMAVADDRPFCEGRGVKIISWQQLIVFLMAKNMCKNILTVLVDHVTQIKRQLEQKQ